MDSNRLVIIFIKDNISFRSNIHVVFKFKIIICRPQFNLNPQATISYSFETNTIDLQSIRNMKFFSTKM